jgi:hypothetical protein
MPAIIINQETFAEGFGEGTEDAKRVIQFIKTIREWLHTPYAFFDAIVQRRAWNPAFYALIQKEYPDQYGEVPYIDAFYRWKNSYKAIWPNLIEEPESEKVRVAETKLKAVIAAAEVLIPILDPENKSRLVQWMADCFNDMKEFFASPLILDYDELRAYVPPMQMMNGLKEPDPAPPFSGRDSARVGVAMNELSRAVNDLNEYRTQRERKRADA